MSKMFAEIKRIVEEDISNRVTQFDVLYEGITNSIHANSTHIICTLATNDLLIEENGTEIGERKVDIITISDNGDGLNNENYDSFCKYRSEYKKTLGCKGVGRFVLLKIYHNAIYESLLEHEQEERHFRFDFEFDADNIQIKKAQKKIVENKTTITLNRLSQSYYDQKRGVDRRILLDLDTIREKALLNLLPTLFFYKKQGTNIKVDFVDSNSNNKVSITDKDIPSFKQKDFEIKDRYGNIHPFKLNHHIDDTFGNLYAFYCANNRTVNEFSDKEFKLSLPYGYSGYLLLESPYFDKNVNNERNDFSIFPVKTDAFSPLSWELINEDLKKVIIELVKEGIPKTKEINKAKISQIYETRPYLVNYIDDTDLEIAGFIDHKQLVEKAKKKFDHEKEKVLLNVGKDEYSNNELQDAIELAQNELVSYINDRVQIIERLRTMIDNKERVEDVIHSLFMEKQTDDDYFSIGKNNLWLLDDRYTTYSYAASDKRIGEVLKSIGEDTSSLIPSDRPDLSLFFSHNPNRSERLKSVIIEIKPFDYASKPDRKKFMGTQQLIDYVKAFKEKENIEEVYAYLITEVDKKLEERLIGDDYKPLFSLENPIFFRYYQNLGISIFVISASTLLKDAEARNKMFLDIIKKQSKIYKILTE